MIAIAGAGLTGMSVSLFLKHDHTVFEKEPQPGGLVRTFHRGDFSFDCAGHWFHSRHEWIKDFMAQALGANWAWHRRDARIWSHGMFTPYPFQLNLGGLPKDVIFDCVMGLIEARCGRWNGQVRDFEEYILRTMGTGIARHFMTPYNRKLWHLLPRQMSVEWLGRFVPEPEIEPALRSALNMKVTTSAGYNAGFYYPAKGSSMAISTALVSRIRPPECGSEITCVCIKKRRITFADGRTCNYDALVNTMPLRRLIEIAEDAPPAVRNAARALNWVSINVLHLGVTDYRNSAHWFYIPERTPSFFRVGCYSNVCRSMAPDGTASLYVEQSYLRKLPCSNHRSMGERAFAWLKEIGVVGVKGRLVTQMCVPIDFGYVLYDHNRSQAVAAIQNYLRKNAIYSIGRYGAWEYSSMEDAMDQGRRTAELLNQVL